MITLSNFENQIIKLSNLKDGWHNGEGKPLDKNGLQLFYSNIKHYFTSKTILKVAIEHINFQIRRDNCYAHNIKKLIRPFQSHEMVQLPRVYPTIEGKIYAEWLDINCNWDCTLEVDLGRQLGGWMAISHNVNGKKEACEVEILNLDLHISWEWILARLYDYGLINETSRTLTDDWLIS